ncbi:MAG: hypothetical protein CMM46_07975 [Rhodospirillaceae bacterium]|nr:hypothetical protein [Rhodospirillaceae bacterium]|tara:strand:- start:2014 stop:3105 length:1092 start_codon:yes stop_codon:yes gene_type:complete
MNPSSFYSGTYAEARAKFLETCAAQGLRVEHHIHPKRGREGEELATDVARFGPENASHVLFTQSATHGVEGFCGSGAQVGALQSGLYDDLPDSMAVVLVHAINPYGFSWLRRVTHENVDLNRNHLEHGQPYPVNEGYEQLKDAICPVSWTPEARASARATLEAYAEAYGPMALQGALSGGQYSHPEGLFFGGHQTTWSAKTMAAVAGKHAASARHVGWIDYHTGLGPYGYGELISDHLLGDPGHARLVDWLGESDVTNTDDGSSTSAPLTGVNSLCVAGAAPHATVTMVTPEFGTSPVDEVLDSLRADCWLHNHGDLDSYQGRAIKAEIRRCFYPDADDWKAMVFERTSDTERKMIAGLATLD